MNFGGTKKADPTVNIKPIKAVLILQISLIGYRPYINLSNQTFINTQQAPSLEQSSFFEPTKVASKKSQSNIGGIDFIVNTSEENHKASNRFAEVISTPIKYTGPVKPGDILPVHHDEF